MTNSNTPSQLLFSRWEINLDEVPIEQLDHYIAVENFLTDEEELPRDADNLEKVRGYLEAFHYLCVLLEWRKAWEILNIRLDTPMNKELHEQLNFWGEYRQQIQLYEQIIDQVDSIQNIKISNCLGKAYFDLGDNESAAIVHTNALQVAKQSNDRQEEGLALRGLGKVCTRRGNLSEALNFFEQHLEVAEATSNRQQQIMALQNIAQVLLFSSKPQYNNIIQLYEQSLRLCQEISDRESQAIALKGLGTCYDRLGNRSNAWASYRQALEIYETNEDIQNIKNLNLGLGNLCARECSFEDSVIYFEKYLSFCQEKEKQYNSQRFMEIYMNLSSILCQISRYEEALKYSNQHLSLASQPDERCTALLCLADIHNALGQLEISLEQYQSALQLAEEINNVELIIDALTPIAHCHNELGNYRDAIKFSKKACKKSYDLLGDINGRNRLSYALGEFGIACRGLRKYSIALRSLVKALEIAVKSEDRLNEAVQKRDLGLTYLAIGDSTQALSYLEDSGAILEEISCPEERFKTLIVLSQIYLELADYRHSILYIKIAEELALQLSHIYQTKYNHLKQSIINVVGIDKFNELML
jgi:tetratricopeptide (TPR) repeat protein